MMGAGAVVLVDFESVQIIDFSQLAGSRLVVFAGEAQRKVPIEVAMGLQALGERARWVRSSGVGPNALDFHIAFEIGRMVEKGEKGPVLVLSHDKGFDPLLTWLGVELGISARRISSLAEEFGAPGQPQSATALAAAPKTSMSAKPTAPIPSKAVKAAPAKPPAKKTAPVQPGSEKKGRATPNAELTRQILARSQKAARPRRRSTLAKHIQAMFKAHAIAEREVESIITKLLANRSISDEEGAITYHF